MKPKKYSYKGKSLTIEELAEDFPGISKESWQYRLSQGWTVAEILNPALRTDIIPEEYRNKPLIICFQKSIPVKQNMHPVLRKPYLAIPKQQGTRGKTFYIIHTDNGKSHSNGKPLIVYPGEFTILRVAKKCEEQECAPPFGEKMDCELCCNGYCMGATTKDIAKEK